MGYFTFLFSHPYSTKKINTRINHHHTNIFNNRRIHISKHFNLPDHSITNLHVQPIDCATKPNNVVEELHRLERFWVKTLQTLTPHVTDLIADQAPLIHNPRQIVTQHQKTLVNSSLILQIHMRVWCSPFLSTTESDSYSERERVRK